MHSDSVGFECDISNKLLVDADAHGPWSKGLGILGGWNSMSKGTEVRKYSTSCDGARKKNSPVNLSVVSIWGSCGK